MSGQPGAAFFAFGECEAGDLGARRAVDLQPFAWPRLYPWVSTEFTFANQAVSEPTVNWRDGFLQKSQVNRRDQVSNGVRGLS